MTARTVVTEHADGRSQGSGLPGWVPDGARHYLRHVTGGTPLRALAREAQVHASTILRQVRRVETIRDDPLVDEALQMLAARLPAEAAQMKEKPVTRPMTDDNAPEAGINAHLPPAEARILREGLRILRRLNEARTVLAVARDMEMGVVVREGADGTPERLAVVAREIAQAMALKEWITCADPGARVIRYRITAGGRQALRRKPQDEGPDPAQGLAEAPARFMGAAATPDDHSLRHMRSLLGDSPITALARRRTRDGEPWLDRAQIAAAERLREDFELSQSGPRMAMDWERFLATARADGTGDLPRGAREARERLVDALGALGPGLADVALRCCCFLEGLESVEERMGWSARSGKVVLRVALDHLRQHYARTLGRYAPPIG